MNNHDQPLPTLHEASLDGAMLEELFSEIRAHATAVSVQVKGGATVHAEQGAVALSEAYAALAGGRVMGVQIRYLRDGEEWCDTLMATGSGTRLIRMKQSQ